MKNSNDHSEPVRSTPRREVALLMLSLPFLVMGVAFLYFIGRFALVGQHPFQFFADSNTYHDVYSGFMTTPGGFIGVSYNFLGPLLLLNITGGNIYLILISNFVIFLGSIIAICRVMEMDPVRTAALQLLSPLTVFSLLSVNKEILVFPVIALLIAGYKYKSVPLVIAAIAVSILARWQLTVFCIVLVGIYPLRNLNRYGVVVVMLGIISFAYYQLQDILEPVFLSAELATSVYTEGSGFFERLLEIQSSGFYAAVAPIKSAHLMFSLGIRVNDILNPINIYNDQIVGLFCFVNIVLFCVLMAKRKLFLRNDLVMISVIYLIVFALTPIYAPRYFYAVTVLWALVLAGAREKIEEPTPQLSKGRAAAGWRTG